MPSWPIIPKIMLAYWAQSYVLIITGLIVGMQ